MGHPFIVKTDQESIKYIMEQRITNSLQQKWLSKLLGFDYTIAFKKGRENLVADALSRRHQSGECDLISVQRPTWRDELVDNLHEDIEVKQIIISLLTNPQVDGEYTYCDGELKRYGRYYVGSTTDLRQRICSAIHNSAEGGHSGIAASIKRAERLFYWPTLK